ncbi:MAG: hypothetical protein K5910_03140 [Bacteroidales bacterium]|nr:hypothetical protein [Bacteroidales bacterium]
MENELQPGSRRTCPSDLSQLRGILRGAGSFLLLCCLYSCPALLGSCRKETPPEVQTEPQTPAVDSVLTRVLIDAGKVEVRTLDLFVYGSSGTRPLEAHRRFIQPGDSLSLNTPEGTKLLVAIANSPKRFNLAALGRYDAMELLRFSFSDDNPKCPILSGITLTDECRGKISLRPLLCRVILSGIANTMDGYELLEEPRVRLCDIPDGAEVLREKDFRPAELIDAGEWAALPFDIGYFPQEPGIELWCYPNDTPENVLGTPRPSLELECRIQGETCSFEVPLPPLPRGCTKRVEITVNGPDDFRYGFP